MPTNAKTILTAGMAAIGLLLTVLTVSSDVHGSDRIAGPWDAGEAIRSRPVPLSQGTALELPSRVPALLPGSQEPGEDVGQTFETVYAGWARHALKARANSLRERFFERLDHEVLDRFDGGRFTTYYEEDGWRSRCEATCIHAVRKSPLGWYEEIVLEPTDSSELYRIQAELMWLDLAAR